MFDTLSVTSGIPQGSILGPLLFLIYVNDLPSSISSSSVEVAMFADDTKYFTIVKSSADTSLLQAEVLNVATWARSWRLKFNPKKCKVLIITRKRRPLLTDYSLDGHVLDHVPSEKDLGMSVCSDLTWSIHIRELITKANRLLGLLRRSAVKVRSTNARRCLYLCIVWSNLAYASQVWNPQSVQLLQDLERIQRRATKFILLLPFRTDI